MRLVLFASAALACALALAQAPDDGQWAMPAKDHAATRFSALDQINAGNAGQLKLAFSMPTGVVRGHEAATIVADNTMYIVTPYPNSLIALDLTQPGAKVKWTFDPKPYARAQGVACCDVVNRGAVYADGRVFFNKLDNQTFAVDAKTGRELWRAQLGNIKLGES